jgi:hypothetical protein
LDESCLESVCQVWGLPEHAIIHTPVNLSAIQATGPLPVLFASAVKGLVEARAT